MKIDTENIIKILKFWETSEQGKKKSIDETYALDLKTAIMVLSHFTIEILGYSLN